MPGESHPDRSVEVAFFVAQSQEAEIPEGFCPKTAFRHPSFPAFQN
jgi:hypothetical protein